MKLLIVVAIITASLDIFQSERNDCYWHGMDNLPAWVYCVVEIRW